MTNQFDRVECGECGASVDASQDAGDYRAPCQKCGCTKRILHGSIEEKLLARDGYGIKAKRLGQRKLYVEDKEMPSYSRKLDKFVHHQRLIDRDNDLYREAVTDYESGEIIHHCEEPLSEHHSHGSAKFKKEKKA